jgi:Rieske 2Fe-2S family protein
MTGFQSNVGDRVRALLAESPAGHTLAQGFYTDPEIYALDVAAVFGRAWLFVGVSSEVAEPGSYLAFTLGRNAAFVVRGRDGVLRGFHNTCRHRGSRICADGHGRSPRIVCPYHKWTYDLDGRLLAAPRMPTGFRSDEHALAPIRVEILAGCIYVSLASDPYEFAAFRAAVEPRLAPYRLAESKVAFRSSLVEKANWKLAMENARECYHCAASHPELRISYPIAHGAAITDEQRDYEQRFAKRMAALGISTQAANGDWWHVERYALNPGMESISGNGQPVVKRRLIESGEPELGGFWWATQPNTFCHALADYAFIFSVVPLGPEETRIDSTWLVHKDAVEGTDYTIETLTETWTETNLQDRRLAENNQSGVNGVGYRPGPYSNEEDFVSRFGAWYRSSIRAAVQALDEHSAH